MDCEIKMFGEALYLVDLFFVISKALNNITNKTKKKNEDN